MKIKVIFRKFKGEIIALFPYENENNGLVLSYQHVGQHSASDYNYVIKGSKPAQVDEYMALKIELESIGYDLTLVQKRIRK